MELIVGCEEGFAESLAEAILKVAEGFEMMCGLAQRTEQLRQEKVFR